MGEIRRAWERLHSKREAWDEEASRNERMTMRVGVEDDGEIGYFVNPNLFTTIGAELVLGLSSVLVSVMFPANVWWCRLTIPARPDLADDTGVQAELAQGDRLLMRTHDQLGMNSIMLAAFQESLVASMSLVHLRAEDDSGPDRARLIPYTRFVPEFLDGALARLYTVVDEYPEGEDAAGRQRPGNEAKRTYIEVDYLGDRIRQETGDDAIADVDDGDNPRRWCVISHLPRLGAAMWPMAYTSHWRRKIEYVNGSERTLRLLMAEAGRVIKGVRIGSGMTTHQLAKVEEPAFLMMKDPSSDVVYPRQGDTLPSSIAAMIADRDSVIDELKTNWLIGLLDRRRPPETATEVQEIVAEANSQAARFYAHHAAHTQAPLAVALMDFAGLRIESPENGAQLEPAILTGLSALSRRDEAERLVQIVERLAQMFPQFAAQMPAHRLFQRMADGLQIQTGDILSANADLADSLSALLVQIEQDPQRAIPVIVQTLQQLDPAVLGAIMSGLGAAAGPQTQQALAASPAATMTEMSQ